MSTKKSTKKKPATRPNRDPDHYSKRGVPYWWAPDWIRGTSSDIIHDKHITYVDKSVNLIQTADGKFVCPTTNYGRIHAVKEKKGDVNLYMKSKEGNLTFIQGSIQKEFKKWHEDRAIDYMLLGMDPDELIAQDD